MVEIIRDSHPEELENFRFLKGGGAGGTPYVPPPEAKPGTGAHKKGPKDKDSA